jgi:CubicO group peptidase (beta-lactamase class C family)
MIQVTEKAIKQVPGSAANFTAFMKAELFDRMGMTQSTYSALLGISSGWEANLSDMGKLGTMLLHDGWYGGERLLSREWVYRMSHPAFEDANTSYGQLAWLNHRGGAAGIGGNISTGANAPEGDPCAPAAFWPKYPHVPSGAPDCRAVKGGCVQKYDVGIFSAQGLNGQFIVIHPGLDMVITARNFSGGDGPLGLWRAVRPALVAMDPMFKGDEAAFCAAYGAGNYAPDLVMPRTAPAGT